MFYRTILHINIIIDTDISSIDNILPLHVEVRLKKALMDLRKAHIAEADFKA